MALIIKVCLNKASGQKFVTIPQSSEIEPGDYVIVKKVVDE